MEEVAQLRERAENDPGYASALRAIKSFQARRFAATYADLLGGSGKASRFGAAARFFLEELYGEKDFADRDAQFARIAGALQQLFPQKVVATAVALAELHVQTERLDHAMALVWRQAPERDSEAGRYLLAWRSVGQRPARQQQLDTVLHIGSELTRLTRTPGLRIMLRMMRRPATAAGLGSLQGFLEAGFDTFGSLAKTPGGAESFLQLIEAREAALIAQLFEHEVVACETALTQLLGQAR